MELSNYNYEIQYREGRLNIAADTFSRCASLQSKQLQNLHESLAHPGVTRFYEYVKRHNLAHTLEDVRNLVSTCKTCLECKPRFFKPPPGSKLVKASRPFERLSLDIVGPKSATPNQYRFLLTIIDEYSRFPFAFPLRQISSANVINCLRQLFSLFGTPAFMHTDRGTQFMSQEFQSFCLSAGISLSRTTPYHPQGNGQCERYNGVICKSISCLLHARNLPTSHWEFVLPDALAAIRTLLCTSTGESPHARMFQYERRGSLGYSIPSWLQSGKPALLKNHVRNKEDPRVLPVQITGVINPYFAKVSFPSGVEDTVSTSSLAPTSSNTVDDENEANSPLDEQLQETESLSDEANNRPVRNRRPPERYIEKF